MSCLSNVKQLALAQLMYADDWDDMVPQYCLYLRWPVTYLTPTGRYAQMWRDPCGTTCSSLVV